MSMTPCGIGYKINVFRSKSNKKNIKFNHFVKISVNIWLINIKALPLHHQIIVELKNNGMNNIESSTGEIVMYQPDETIRLEVRMDEETVWLTQQQMAELFQKDQSVVARHINNAFKEGELDENSNMHFLHNTRYKYRPTKVYSLDVIISLSC